MNKIWLVVVAVMALSVSGYCQEKKQEPKEFGGIVTGVASMSAVVETINYETREVTLKDTDNKIHKFKVGPEARNLDQVVKGDKVNIAYSETVKMIVSDVAQAPEAEQDLEVVRAPLGEKPAGLMVAKTQVIATVEAIDYEKRIVTLKGPEKTFMVQVGGEAPNFSNVKVGDTVNIEYIERAAVSVTK